MNLRIFENLDDLSTATARTIVERVRGRAAATIVLTGGSTPAPLYRLLAQPPWRGALEKAPITWVLLDERYVPSGDPQSNGDMIERTLFAGGVPRGHRWLRFDTSLDDPAATARLFEQRWHALGVDKLDLALLGCGEDGHVASLFPDTPVLDVEDRIAAEVFVPRLRQWRVTLTRPVIRSADLRLVLASGAAKAPIIRELRNGANLPVAAVTKGVETWWMVDRAACLGPSARD